MIKVYDNVLSEDLLNFIKEEILGTQWTVHGSNDPFGTKNGFFYCITTNWLSHNYLLKLFNKNKMTKTDELLRSYVNCYPPQSQGEFHTDDGMQTLLFFTDDWEDKWQGEVMFKDNDSVDYVKNRLVVFDSTIEHKANINFSYKNRHTIAWKTTI
tara:strand:+ start:58 stop:522 length:465 start_codon:yes stop_codon:yes gene_type:complete